MGRTNPVIARRWAGLAAVVLFVVMVARFWQPVFGFTALLQLDASNDEIKIPAFRQYPIYVYRHTGGYDGLSYAQIAYDPTLRSPDLRRAVDDLAYRGRRIAAPALAWLLAAGRPAWIAQVYAALNIAAWLALAGLLWRWLPVADWKSWSCWAGVMFSAGALTCVRLSLTDLMAATLVAGAVAAASGMRRTSGRGSVVRSSGWLALAALTRETSLLALPAFLARPWFSRRNAQVVGIAVLPLLAWLVYVRCTVGAGESGVVNLTWPAAGLLGKWTSAVAALRTQPDHLLVIGTVLATASITVQAAWLLWQRDGANPWWRIGAAFIALMLFLDQLVWVDFPGAAFRTLLPLTFAFNVLAARRAAPWTIIIAGNLTVLAGLLAFRDPPFDDTELAQARRGSETISVHEDTGWFGAEHSWNHRWAWAGSAAGAIPGPATVALAATPGEVPQSIHCSGKVRALVAEKLTISEGGRTLWSGAVGTHVIPIAFDASLVRGRGEIVFATDRPPQPEAPDPGARSLAFALYDLKVTFADAGAAPP